MEKEHLDFDAWLHHPRLVHPMIMVRQLSPIREFLPNLEEFVFWFYDLENGFHPNLLRKMYKKNHYEVTKRYYEEFTKVVFEKIGKYSTVEKAVFFRMMMTTINSDDDNLDYQLIDIEQRKKGGLSLDSNATYNIGILKINFKEILDYCETKFLRYKPGLPFKIKNGLVINEETGEFYTWRVDWTIKDVNLQVLTELTKRNGEENENSKPKNSYPGKLNDYTLRLFEYIIEEYEAAEKIKFINIWYFLKRDIVNKENILFNFTQEKYKAFIKEKYGTDIKKFARADFKYIETEVGLLQNIAETFRKNEKDIKLT